MALEWKGKVLREDARKPMALGPLKPSVDYSKISGKSQRILSREATQWSLPFGKITEAAVWSMDWRGKSEKTEGQLRTSNSGTWLWLWTWEWSHSGETMRDGAISQSPRTFPTSLLLPQKPQLLHWDSQSEHIMFSNSTSPCRLGLLLLTMKNNQCQTCPVLSSASKQDSR